MSQKPNSTTNSLKFLYSYGGRIVPRSSDGKLRYVGGYTRVLSIDRSITYAELMVKFGESCGSSVNLKCKLPSEDLDVLVSVKSDEDLRSVMDEYERESPEAKIRAVLFPSNCTKKVSPPSSPMSCFDFPSAPLPPRVKAPSAACYHAAQPYVASHRCSPPAVGYPVTAGKYRCYEARSPRRFHHVPQRNNSH
ncbi:UNVERIFIED_CONTAM: hypothetical protein Sangu_2013100 [Sesamum angustifolium]|uniref:PB1 domain-containing protein n=1 Tax=Sesamum angustifolium TaxID=2727405 RepID=A0AAW2LHK1_9LAMI